MIVKILLSLLTVRLTSFLSHYYGHETARDGMMLYCFELHLLLGRWESIDGLLKKKYYSLVRTFSAPLPLFSSMTCSQRFSDPLTDVGRSSGVSAARYFMSKPDHFSKPEMPFFALMCPFFLSLRTSTLPQLHIARCPSRFSCLCLLALFKLLQLERYQFHAAAIIRREPGRHLHLFEGRL